MIFCINCNCKVKDDEEYYKVDDLSAAAIETLTNHGCELIAGSIICNECWVFISKGSSIMDTKDKEPLVANSLPTLDMCGPKLSEADNKYDTAKSHGTKRKLLNNDSDLTIKTARIESASQAGLVAKPMEREHVNGLDNEYLESNPDVDLWPEEADECTNLIKPTVHIPVWAAPLDLCDIKQTAVESNLNNDLLCKNHVDNISSQLQSVLKNQVDHASQTFLCNVKRLCDEPHSNRSESCNSNDENIVSSIPSPPPPPTWPSKLELKRLLENLPDSNTCADTLTKYCESETTNIIYNQSDNSSARHNRESTKPMISHSEDGASGRLSHKCSVSVCKRLNLYSSSNDQKSISEKQSNKSWTCKNRHFSKTVSNVIENKCSDTNRKGLRNNQDMFVHKLNDQNQLFNHPVVSAVSLKLASLAQDILYANVALNQQLAHSTSQRVVNFGLNLTKKHNQHNNNVPNGRLQSIDEKKEGKRKRKRGGRPRNGGRTLPDGTRMKQYKRPLPGSKTIKNPVLTSSVTEGKTSKLNTININNEPGQEFKLTVCVEDSRKLNKSIQPSVKENSIRCSIFKDEIITVDDTDETELGTHTSDLGTYATYTSATSSEFQ